MRPITDTSNVCRLAVKLAQAAVRLGRFDRAREILSQAQRLDPFTNRFEGTASVLESMGDITGRNKILAIMLDTADWSTATTVLSNSDPALRAILAKDLAAIRMVRRASRRQPG